MIVSLIVFFAVLAVLVLVHEFGHFITAKKKGIRVDEFGFGFPPRLFGIKKGDTFYSFNLLPLGGFVKIFGEDNGPSSDPKSFSSKSISERAGVIAAGVFFNILLAVFLFALISWLGMPVDAENPPFPGKIKDANITIIDVLPHSAAEAVELKIGDKILSLAANDGQVIRPVKISDVREFSQNYRGSEIFIEILRRNEPMSFNIILPEQEKDGAILGITMVKIGIFQAPWYFAPLAGIELTAATAARTMAGLGILLGMVFSGDSVAGLVSGPVGIFGIVSGSIDFGPVFLLSLIAALSVNLAIINLVPFPALDGGRLLFLVIEAFRGRPISQKIGGLAHAAGFAILIILMVVITYYDLRTTF